jgi:photosystem II stability/assembly factor-like uncharacterized protein
VKPTRRSSTLVLVSSLGALATACSDGGAAGSADAGVPDYEDAVAGATWRKLPVAPQVTGGAKQDDIYFVDPARGFVASGPAQSIYATEDGGATWTSVFQSPGTYFRALLFLDAERGFAGNLGPGLSPSIDDPNVLYATQDGGATWAPIPPVDGDAPAGICNLFALDATHLFGVGRVNGPAHLIRSSDGGASWSSADLGAVLMMAIDVRFSSPTEGLVVGMGPDQRCTIARTTDGGETFASVFTSATPGSLCWKLDFPSADVGYVAIQDSTDGPGTIGKTLDGGATWQELPLPTTAAYPALAVGFATESVGWVVSEDATAAAYRTRDGGATWEPEPALRGPINRFRFVDAATAYAIGASIWKLEIDVDQG